MKELIDWDQARQDVQVKYTQVVEQFSTEASLIRKSSRSRGPATPPSRAVGGGQSDTDRRWRRHAARSCFGPDQARPDGGDRKHPNGGAEAFAEAFARLDWPESGKVVSGSADLFKLPEVSDGPADILCIVRCHLSMQASAITFSTA